MVTAAFDDALFDPLLFDTEVAAPALPPEAVFEVGFTLELFSGSGFTEETITEA